MYNLFNSLPLEGHLGRFSSLIITKGSGMKQLVFKFSSWFEKVSSYAAVLYSYDEEFILEKRIKETT